VDYALDVRWILVRVASEAKRGRRGSDQLYASDISIDTNLMATGTTHRNGSVYVLALGLVFVAFQAFCGVDVFVEGDGMDVGSSGQGQEQEESQKP
jgi:hypothetical protein